MIVPVLEIVKIIVTICGLCILGMCLWSAVDAYRKKLNGWFTTFCVLIISNLFAVHLTLVA
jgi:hypothetical protein